MRFPFTLHIGQYPVLLHGLFEFAGIFVAFRYYVWLRKQQGDTISQEHRIYAITGAALGAVIGARLVGAMENLPEWMSAPSAWAYFAGNKTLVGGLLGGLAGVEIAKKIAGEKRSTGDLFTYPLLAGMIIGRIGCFSAGIHEETYGVPSHLPWSMDLGDGIARHPVTLYEIVFLVLLWIGLASVRRRFVLDEGALFKLFMIAYLVYRFLQDFIKPGWRYCLGMGTIQLVCIAGLLYYGRYIIHPRSLIVSKRGHAS